MFVLDVPNSPPEAPTLMVAQSSQAKQPASTERVMGNCRVVQNFPGLSDSLRRVTLPFPGDATSYLYYFEKRDISEDGAKVTLLRSPEHGLLDDDKGTGVFTYRPDPGYYGKDKVVALVGVGGYRVKVAYFIQIVKDENVGDDTWEQKYCGPKGSFWKISVLGAPVDASDYQSLLSFAGIGSSLTVETVELSGGAIGQTTGTNITLDTNAAGHGWYIDYTPYLNEAFLPTSNPNEWVAKAGSEAAGKMGLLSVLLHEYGHALGIEHSDYAHDYMATTLQPGVRRMPGSEELTLMAKLLGAT